MIRRAAPVRINGREFSREWLDDKIAVSRDPEQNMDRGLEAETWHPPVDNRVRQDLDEIRHMENEERVYTALKKLQTGGINNLKHILPLVLSLDGKPFHLGDQFPFEPFFNVMTPRRLTFKTGRQLGKSTSMAARGILQSITIPYFNTLFVTPVYEMIRRFSTNYVQTFIDQSPVRHLFMDGSCSNNVLQRSFLNQSKMFFSFAFLDANRTRGLSCSQFCIDEVQDMDPDFIPIIREVVSGSKRWGLEQFTGTPKALSGGLETLWQASSQAEWHIKCTACNKENIPAMAYDLDAMLGPSNVTRKISLESPGVVCAKCGKPIDPRTGHWVHHKLTDDKGNPLRLTSAGYHIPQFLLPLHYASAEKWSVLIGKRDGFGNTAPHVFYNEVCGESYDFGARLVTMTDLRRACTGRPNTLDYAAEHAGDYVERVLAVDWGGGGQEEVSFTVMVVLGLRADGKVDVLYGHRFKNMHNYAQEAHAIIHVMQRCQCNFVVHDFGGRGDLREHLLRNAGLSVEQLIPVSYIRAASGPLFRMKEENERTGQRMYYQCDKTRSLSLTCDLIRTRMLRFFSYDFKGTEQQGLIHDFLSLVEDTIASRTANEIYTVIRDEKAGPDDFAQAVNIGVCALYHMRGEWPDLAMANKLAVNPRILEQLSPVAPSWDMLS